MCCYGILLKTKSYMGTKENQSNLERKKKCLVDVVACLQPPVTYNTELDTENAAGRSTCPVSHHFLWRLCIWSGLMPALTQPFLHSHNHETHMGLTHPHRLLCSTCLPSSLCRQQFLNLFTNNHGPSPALWP